MKLPDFRAAASRARNLLAAVADQTGQVELRVGPFHAVIYSPHAVTQTPRETPPEPCAPPGACRFPGRCLAHAAEKR